MLMAACSAIVEPPSRIRCDPGATEAVCGDGHICATEGADRGYCIPFACVAETCDGNDNDCDGIIDEDLAGNSEECDADDNDCDGLVDEGFDEDNDGFTACGTTDCDRLDGDCRLEPGRVDCNDALDNVNPEAPELCDAIDHNCDGVAVPEGAVGPDGSAPRDVLCADPSPWCEPTVGCVAADCNAPRAGAACGGGQVCDPSSGNCVSVDCTPEECAALAGDFFCSPVSGDCEMRKGPGEDCNLDDECSSSVCAAPESLGVARANPGICVEACCSDNDCAVGQFCWDFGIGTKSCVPLGFQPELTGRSQLGNKPAGQTCGGDSECRSGLCDVGTCTGPCSAASQCAVGACGPVNRRDGRVVASCESSFESGGSSCSSDAQCGFGRCSCLFDFCACDSKVCGSDADCGGLAGDNCVYYRSVSGVVWAECSNSSSAGEACCRTGQCGAGQVCRPQLATQNDGRLWPMYCVDAAS
ncbi:MAG: hypothetical protein CMN30_06790 [Sandaracinus sp.]|nr:hypothetical protein [Sandaracinus sp.]